MKINNFHIDILSQPIIQKHRTFYSQSVSDLRWLGKGMDEDVDYVSKA